MTVAIVIPFYQKQQGILSNCLNSIFNQTETDFHIFIANDESPSPPEIEITPLTPKQKKQITLLHRKNGGPGQARNTALEEIRSRQFEYVAFIDSDDAWTPTHLENALAVLFKGYDFYFSNFYQLENDVSVFEKAQKKGSLCLSKHNLIAEQGNYEYVGDFAQQIICGNLIGTSNVVFRNSIGKDIRFNKKFYYAGEDYLFWLDFTQHTGKFAFNTTCTSRCGRGVNIYSANGWGSPHALERIKDELTYLSLTKEIYPLQTKYDQIRSNKIASLKKMP